MQPQTSVSVSIVVAATRTAEALQRWITPLFDLALRLYLAEVFLRAGWLKLTAWSNTLDLFRYVYAVPVLPPPLAAALGTAGEVGFSVLLALGLGGRLAAAGLFAVNLVAAISFPDISELGLKDHWLWGALLLVPLFHGVGPISLDRCIRARVGAVARELR